MSGARCRGGHGPRHFFVRGEEAAQLARAAGNVPLLDTARSREHDRKLDAPGLGRLRGPLKAIWPSPKVNSPRQTPPQIQRPSKLGPDNPKVCQAFLRQAFRNEQSGGTNPADGANSDFLISNSLFWNLQGACSVAVVPLNPKVLGSIPGAGTNNASRQPSGV